MSAGFLRRFPAAVYMLIAVSAFSTTPLLHEFGNASHSPFLFAGLNQGSLGLALGCVFLAFNRKLVTRPDVASGLGTAMKSGLMIVSVLGHCGFALFALGLVYVNTSVAAVLFNTWPLFMILAMSWLFRGSARYSYIATSVLVVVPVGLVGVAFAVISHSNVPQPFLALSDVLATPGTMLGVFLVLVAAACEATRGCAIWLGARVAVDHSPIENRHAHEIVFAIVLSSASLVAAGFILCLVGLAWGERLTLHQLSYAVLGGVFISTMGTAAFRVANLKTRELGVNAIGFVKPLMSMMWLWAFAVLDVGHVDYLVIGVTGVATAIFLVNAGLFIGLAHRGLVVSLWLVGISVYIFGEQFFGAPLLFSTAMLCVVSPCVCVFLCLRRLETRMSGLPVPRGALQWTAPFAVSVAIVLVFAFLFSSA